jgi:hypothetical protein
LALRFLHSRSSVQPNSPRSVRSKLSPHSSLPVTGSGPGSISARPGVGPGANGRTGSGVQWSRVRLQVVQGCPPLVLAAYRVRGGVSARMGGRVSCGGVSFPFFLVSFLAPAVVLGYLVQWCRGYLLRFKSIKKGRPYWVPSLGFRALWCLIYTL